MSNQTLTLSNFDDNYWRQNYSSRQYVEKGANYEDYQLAYQTGHEGCDRYHGKSFEEAETELKRDYEALLAQKVEQDWLGIKSKMPFEMLGIRP